MEKADAQTLTSGWGSWWDAPAGLTDRAVLTLLHTDHGFKRSVRRSQRGRQGRFRVCGERGPTTWSFAQPIVEIETSNFLCEVSHFLIIGI